MIIKLAKLIFFLNKNKIKETAKMNIICSNNEG